MLFSFSSDPAKLRTLAGKVLIDTTNQFGASGLVQLVHGYTAAEVNA